jgi:N-acetylglucosamine-6-sulfatase
MVLVVFLCFVAVLAGSPSPREAQAATRPNILFILTDDQDPESMGRMANVQRLLAREGTTFANAFATTPTCCPSRVSFMRGQYTHNHGVLNEGKGSPLGGYKRFRELGLQNSTIATWLDKNGYATFYAGKFLNQYKDTRYVPPGWDKWYTFFGNGGGRWYTVNENGKLKTYAQDQQHETYYLRDKAEAFIRDRARRSAPWFAWVSTHAPHTPHNIAPKFRHSYDNKKMPRPPSYNEADVSDKPKWVRDLPRLDSNCSTDEGKLDCHREVVQEWRARQEALMSVDVMVKDLVSTLNKTNQMRRTYIVFASDNGYLLYRHRHYSKGAPYEESQGVPFVVRGPGVRHGVVDRKLVANIDLAPTIAKWAGVQPPKYVDGRSLDPLLSGGATAPWRRYLLFEKLRKDPSYGGIRTSRGETYVRYESGEREYYDLTEDPWQLRSGYAEPENTPRLHELSAVLSDLNSCAGAGCRAADGGP